MALIVMPCVGIIAFTGSVLFGTNIDAGMSFLSTTTIIPAFIGGMLLAASTAFIITTGTSYLLTCGTSVTYDFYKQYINKTPDDSQTLWVNRIGTALIGIIALIILNFFPTILALQNWSYTMIGASITPAVLGSMFSKKVTPSGWLPVHALRRDCNTYLGTPRMPGRISECSDCSSYLYPSTRYRICLHTENTGRRSCINNTHCV